jgi:glycosyltransferase involved in cell wall biosynthesis
MRWLYPQADMIVAVSEGVREDIAALTGLDHKRIIVIPNPVVTPELLAQADKPLIHPWFQAAEPPVILGVGRLTRQKDFPTLLQAFAEVRKRISCRLVVLGEGRDRNKLEALASTLGIENDIALPGFVANPYPYMVNARVFVLSSAWEGSPNVLTEALALGMPVVATDCPSGPREILQNGRHGRLVPPGRPGAMAKAIVEMMETPPLRQAPPEIVDLYGVKASARRYLDVMIGDNR